eukprot:Pgem_evm1s7935
MTVLVDEDISITNAGNHLTNTARNHEGAIKLYNSFAPVYDKTLEVWGYDAPQ